MGGLIAVADPGGGGAGGGDNITLQNTDFGVLQKSSKHFLIYFFFLSIIFFPHLYPP